MYKLYIEDKSQIQEKTLKINWDTNDLLFHDDYKNSPHEIYREIPYFFMKRCYLTNDDTSWEKEHKMIQLYMYIVATSICKG